MGYMARDLTGLRFCRLVAIERVNKVPGRGWLWLCRCDCGNEHLVITNCLTSGNTKSCGCLNDETRRARIAELYERRPEHQKHGMSRTETYQIWHAAKSRCEFPNCNDYPEYGGRGIRMCEAWSHSFKAFLEDMGERPKGLTLDRINNDGNYEPGNCRWATYTEQNRNKSGLVWITFDNRTQLMSDWARELGISKKTLWARLQYMTVERAFSKPVSKGGAAYRSGQLRGKYKPRKRTIIRYE